MVNAIRFRFDITRFRENFTPKPMNIQRKKVGLTRLTNLRWTNEGHERHESAAICFMQDEIVIAIFYASCYVFLCIMLCFSMYHGYIFSLLNIISLSSYLLILLMNERHQSAGIYFMHTEIVIAMYHGYISSQLMNTICYY